MAYEFFNKWAPIFMDLLIKDFNLDVLDTAAIVGNAGHESGGFKDLQEIKPIVKGSRGGYGIMMWTGPRRRAYEAYCKRNNLNPANMDTNYKFLFVELKGPEGKSVLPKLKAAPTLEKKVRVFSEVFLRPGIPHMESRQIWAKRAMAAWNSNDVDIPEVPMPEPKPEPKPEVPKDDPWWIKIIKALIEAFRK